jgi:hypothetical protein
VQNAADASLAPSIEAVKPAAMHDAQVPGASDPKAPRPHRGGASGPEPMRKKPKREPSAAPSEVETEWK